MTDVGPRIKRLRTDRGLTQAQLAERVGMTYVQIGRYERAKSTPSAQAVERLARALDTTADYLMTGGTDASADDLADRELLRQFRAVQDLPPDDKHLVKTFLDAFVTKRRIQELAQ